MAHSRLKRFLNKVKFQLLASFEILNLKVLYNYIEYASSYHFQLKISVSQKLGAQTENFVMF